MGSHVQNLQGMLDGRRDILLSCDTGVEYKVFGPHYTTCIYNECSMRKVDTNPFLASFELLMI